MKIDMISKSNYYFPFIWSLGGGEALQRRLGREQKLVDGREVREPSTAEPSCEDSMDCMDCILCVHLCYLFLAKEKRRWNLDEKMYFLLFLLLLSSCFIRFCLSSYHDSVLHSIPSFSEIRRIWVAFEAPHPLSVAATPRTQTDAATPIRQSPQDKVWTQQSTPN